MKFKSIIVPLIIVALPIIWLCIQLNIINETYNTSGDTYKKVEEEINNIIENEVNNANNDSQENNNSSGETHTSIYGNPISKIIENARINVTSANIYQEPDDTSSLVASVYKDTIVSVQDYENGWSNIKSDDLTGWIKSEYVTRPDDSLLVDEPTTAVGHKAVITVNTYLNVRASASKSAEAIDQIKNGQEVNIIGANDDESWYQIQYGTKSGWIMGDKDYVKIVN